MNYIRKRRHRTKKKALKRFFRKMLKRYAICFSVVLVLVTAWKLTSFAVKNLSPEKDHEAAIQETKEISDKKEPLQETFNSDTVSSGSENLLLVNKDHPLDENYQPNLKRNRDYGVDVDASIFDALCWWLERNRACPFGLLPGIGVRSGKGNFWMKISQTWYARAIHIRKLTKKWCVKPCR